VRTTCNNSWNTDDCYDGLLRGYNKTESNRELTTTTGPDVMEYLAGTATVAVNFTVNVSATRGGGVSPALEYFELV